MEYTDLLSTLCGNHDVYKDILMWLKTFNYNEKISEKSCIFVAGNACIGKTYSLNKICEFLKLYVIQIDTYNCWNSSQFKDILFKSITSCLVQNIENTKINKVIIIDNFDSLFSADKTINQAILQILKEKKMKNIPIICITNQETLKKLGDIKKLCSIYELLPPSTNDIIPILKTYNLKTNRVQNMIKKTGGNLNQIFENIHSENIYEYDKNDKHHDIIYLYNCAKFDRKIIRNILQTDAWLIPLRFHENLILELDNRIGINRKKNCFYVQFINLFCYFDVLMNSNNIECALEIFVSIIYFLTVLKIKKNANCNMNKFTKILSYLSLQKKYIKHYFNSNFPLYQIGNYHTCLLNRKFIYFN
jgi:nucleoside-triphosphatase THEP1